jgi:beta-carotene 3-hydroxylase
MECVTWLTHKYVMHGFMWYWHEDHHQPKYEQPIWRNDIFIIRYTIDSSFLFWADADLIICFLSIGDFAYGLSYFMIHDVLIHQRFKWFKHTNNI